MGMRLFHLSALAGLLVATGSVQREHIHEKRCAAVDPRNLIAYFEMFLAEPSYSAEDAMQVLGDKEEFDVLGIELNPKLPEVESAHLKLLENPPTRRPQSLKAFLCGVSLDFFRDRGPRISFVELTRKFGEPQELPLPPPRLLPGQPYRPDYTYAFDAKGKVFRGSLMLTVDGKRSGDLNRVIRVSYRRYSRN